jgi:predicted  nucleic acid-binding Zn-ribbon protein
MMDLSIITDLEKERDALRAEVERLDNRRIELCKEGADKWSEIQKLKSDLAAAVRLLKSCLNGLSYMDRTEARAFLARMEVRT